MTLPEAWFTRWVTDEVSTMEKGMLRWQIELTNKYNKITGNDYVYLGGEFHEDIKFVHFTHSLNKPHLWEDYMKHVDFVEEISFEEIKEIWEREL